jgi:alpha-N-arabinofuranosidase
MARRPRLRHADRVRMACLAQLVNVIPAISTLDGGPAWRQTTFFPLLHAARHGRGTVLRVEPDAPTYDVPDEGAVPVLEATAVHDAESGQLTVFAVSARRARWRSRPSCVTRRARADRAPRALRRRPDGPQHR